MEGEEGGYGRWRVRKEGEGGGGWKVREMERWRVREVESKGGGG